MMKKLTNAALIHLLILALILTAAPLHSAAAKKKMKLSMKILTLKKGSKKKLKVKNKKGRVKWKSSNKKIAVVSKKGIVTAKKVGKATIKAIVTYKKKSKTLKCTVYVVKKTAKSPAPKSSNAPKKTSETAKRTIEPVYSPTVSATVSGVLKCGTSETVSGEEIVFQNQNDSRKYKVVTEAGGAYKQTLPAGYYDIYWNGFKVDSLAPDRASMTHDINAKNMFRVSGTLYRNGAPWKNCPIKLCLNRSIVIDIQSDAQNGTYSVYLPKDAALWVMAGETEIGTLDILNGITTHINYDIQFPFSQVSGKLTAANGDTLAGEPLRFLDGSGKSVCEVPKTGNDGSYSVYLRPGTYTAVTKMNTACGGKITVGENDATVNLQAPLYRVSGTVSNYSRPLADYNLNVDTDESGVETGSCFLRTDSEGRYKDYLPAGTYKIYSGSDSGSLAKTLTVEADTTQDFDFSYYEISGRIYRTAGTEFTEEISEALTIWGPDNKKILTLDIPKDKEYHICTEKKGTYTVCYNDFVLDTFNVEDKKTEHDIVSNLYRISGHITNQVPGQYTIKMNFFPKSPEGTGSRGINVSPETNVKDGKIAYQAYLPAGTYSVSIDYDMQGTHNMEGVRAESFDVSGDSSGRDFEAAAKYRVYGTVSRLSKPWSSTESMAITFTSGHAESTCIYSTEIAPDGTYELYLPPETYSISYPNSKSMPTVTVKDQPVRKNIDISAVRLSGCLLCHGRPITENGGSLNFYYENNYGAGAPEIDENGYYSLWLEPDQTYSVMYSSCSDVLGTVKIGKQDTVRNFELHAKVSGIVKKANGEGLESGKLYLQNKNDPENGWASVTLDEYHGNPWETPGSFTLYVNSGTYQISNLESSSPGPYGEGAMQSLAWGKDFTVNTDSFTVTDEDISLDLQTSLCKVNATATWPYITDSLLITWLVSPDCENPGYLQFSKDYNTFSFYLSNGRYAFIPANEDLDTSDFAKIPEKYKFEVNGKDTTLNINL